MLGLKSRLFSVLMCTILLPLAMMAQPKDNDPYSRLGLGSLLPVDFVAPASLGGLGAVYHDQYHLNLSNPAASSFLEYTSFEVSGFARFSKFKTSSGEFDSWGGNMGYIALGFPLQNPLNKLTERKSSPVTWGMSFGLVPNSQVAYQIQTVQEPITDDFVISTHKGTGGTYKFLWNNSWKYKNLSAGIGLGYMFGKISSEKRDEFANFALSYDNLFIEEVSVGGLVWNLGAIYEYVIPKTKAELKKDPTRKRLSIGAYGNSSYKLNTESNTGFYRQGAGLVTTDTISEVTGLKGKITYPTDFSIGLMYSKDYAWKIGASLKYTNWADFTEGEKPSQGLLKNTELKNALGISLGGEITPDYRSYNNYLKRIRYRFGTFYRQDARDFNGQLTQYGVSVGFGLPLILQRGLPSFIDIGLELGRFGNDSNALEQTYGRLTVGFTLNDNSWFIKRKFD